MKIGIANDHSAVDMKNEISVEVTNTLGNGNRDGLSQYLAIEPFGIIGPVELREGGIVNE